MEELRLYGPKVILKLGRVYFLRLELNSRLIYREFSFVNEVDTSWGMCEMDITRIDLIRWIEEGSVDVLLPSLAWLTIISDKRLAAAITASMADFIYN